MYFIDESILPSEQEYMSRYFRKPENYPELAELVSKYCFRTLRSQAKYRLILLPIKTENIFRFGLDFYLTHS